jgi:hypothetical protein
VPQILPVPNTQNGWLLPTLQSVLPHESGTVDRFFTDLGGDSVVDIQAAEALFASPAWEGMAL